MTVSLEEMAQIQSEIDAGADRATVLAAATLDDAAWQSAKLEWLEAMSDELGRGKSALLSRYAAQFVQHQATLAAQSAPVALPTRSTEAAASEARKVDLPSFLAENKEPAQVVRAHSAPLEAPAFAAPLVAPPASMRSVEAAIPIAEAAIPTAMAGASLKETAAVDLTAILRSLPTPFQAGSAAKQPPTNEASTTDEMDMSSFRSASPLPFAAVSPTGTPAPIAALPSVPVAAAPKPSAPVAPIAETTALDFASIQDQVAQIIASKGRSLPFDSPQSTPPLAAPARSAAPPAAAPPPPVIAPDAAAPRRAPLPAFAQHTAFASGPPAGPATPFIGQSVDAAPPARSPNLAQTTFAPSTPHTGTPLPFPAPPAPPAPRRAPLDWSIDRYAALSIDLASTTGSRDEVLASHGLTPDDHRALAAHWQAELTRPEIGAQWKAACDRARASRISRNR
jgi:hypothetical protein